MTYCDRINNTKVPVFPKSLNSSFKYIGGMVSHSLQILPLTSQWIPKAIRVFFLINELVTGKMLPESLVTIYYNHVYTSVPVHLPQSCLIQYQLVSL